jgi:nucleoside-diphosphate-sugar epimerase
LVTGANGYVAGRMVAGLAERCELTLLDVSMPRPEELGLAAVGDGVRCVEADLLEDPPESYADAFEVDVVVHCGHVWPAEDAPAPEKLEFELRNIRMASTVYLRAAETVRSAPPRVVVAGSNHAADYYEPLVLRGDLDHIDPGMAPRADNFYGWSKAAVELLGFMWACGRESSRVVETVNIRIGSPRETDVADCAEGDLVCLRRALGAYLSVRDQIEIFVRAIEADDIRDENGTPFQIVYGISGNSHRFWSLVSARRTLGYEPHDDSQERFRSELNDRLAAAARSR